MSTLETSSASLTGKNSIIQDEVNHFNALAKQWWDPLGPMRPLHEMNTLRIEWIHNILKNTSIPTHKSRLLDIGCGAGLVSEALAKSGYNVLGVDAASEVIQAAQSHLKQYPLPSNSGSLSYQTASVETLLKKEERFKVITSLELIEHVNNPQIFLNSLADLLQPQGMIFISTLNRTMQSFLLAKVAAEYLLRKLPIGTHQWKKFITPEELRQIANQAGLRIIHIAGMSFKLNRWKLSSNLKTNYIACLSN